MAQNSVLVLKAILSDWEGHVRGMPYRTLAVSPRTSLCDLAFAINRAFDFDHAFGFFENLKDPYGPGVRYELFADMGEDGEGEEELSPAEAELARVSEEIGQETIDRKVQEAAIIAVESLVLPKVRPDLRQQVSELIHEMWEEAPEGPDDLAGALLAALQLPTSQTPARGVKATEVGEVFAPKKKMLYLFDYGDEWHFRVECLRGEPAEAKARYPKLLESVGEAPPQYGDHDDDDE